MISAQCSLATSLTEHDNHNKGGGLKAPLNVRYTTVMENTYRSSEVDPHITGSTGRVHCQVSPAMDRRSESTGTHGPTQPQTVKYLDHALQYRRSF